MNYNFFKKLHAIREQALKIVVHCENLKTESDLNHIWNIIDVESGELEVLINHLKDCIPDDTYPDPDPSWIILFCERCKCEVEAKLTKIQLHNGGFHTRADCPECGKYIKFIKH